jgi:hypothetical protein
VTLKVAGSGEIVQQVFWLDTRTRTCGVMLLNPETGYERCSERPLADLIPDGSGGNGKAAWAGVELYLGDRAGVILSGE